MSAMPFPRSFSLLTPLLWVAAMFLLLLAVRNVLQNRSSRKGRDGEAIEWGRPQPSLIQRWRIKMGGIRFRLPRLSRREMPEIAPKPAPSVPANAPADPLKKPHPADACALCFDRQGFDHRCARDQTQRGVRLGENEGNRMRDKLPTTPVHG
jgi:hypothetical protein